MASSAARRPWIIPDRSPPFFAWVRQANAGTDGKPILAQSKIKLVEAAVNKPCADQDSPRKMLFQAHRSEMPN